MHVSSEKQLLKIAEDLGSIFRSDKFPIILELVGDVGAGKTTFVRGLAKGLGIKDPITSPSFTICNHYKFNSKTHERSAHEKCDTAQSSASDNFSELIHYDFYRLADPGLMQEDLKESLENPCAITVLEWADTVQNLLPKNHYKISFTVNEDDSRTLNFNNTLKEHLK